MTNTNNTYTREFTDEQVRRLARLSASGDYTEAVDNLLEEVLGASIGKPTITGLSSGKKLVSAPSRTFGV